MSLRRASILAAVAVVSAACTESVEQDGQPDEVIIASFSPLAIPLPERPRPSGRADALPGIQQELLQSFVVKGGFPSDQEVAITIPFRTSRRNADGTYSPGPAPASLDLTTVNGSTVAVVKVAPGAAERIPVEVGGYANGTLRSARSRRAGSRRWAPGRYVAALRGGANGVKASDGREIGAEQAIALVAQNVDLTNRENQPPGGLPAAQVAQLSQLQGFFARPLDLNGVETPTPAGNVVLWQPGAPAQGQLSALAAVDTVFPHQELAEHPDVRDAAGVGTAAHGHRLGPARVPVRLPPRSRDRQGPQQPAFGPAAAGLATLDGFSTTAPLLIPLSAPVDASTITKASVRIYRLTPSPVQLRDLSDLATGGAPQIVTQPPQFVSSGASTTIALAPAVPVEQGLPGGLRVYIPPLARGASTSSS